MEFGYAVTSSETKLAPAVVVATVFLLVAFAIGLLRQALLLL